ncbi:histidinol-phosphate transaminase [Fuchsiella alkaliacetigena]|uniref:histidinol-phosphate transaminase n=1 Tax=Fuchsiella alkaliacetigena TaxID=957042 RepID=UPI00200B8467|nr:histidinol-phosphate transaminase [Fuchsiella alkaliacetigena]MCK8823941.1 histidinol-phosphate transaminase [Fuchsiella alkaliacetigena]
MIREEILEISPYVPGKPIEEVKRELGLDEVIKLASNENPIGPPSKAIEAMQSVAEEVHIYPDGNCHYLRRALSEKLGVSQEQLIFGNGSDGLLGLIAETFIKPGDEVIMAYPSFSQYEFVTNIMGGNIVTVPLVDYTHDLAAMKKAISANTKLIFVCNPNNPTGTVVTKSEVEAFLEEVPEEVVVIFDEAYYEYVDNEEYPESLDYLEDYENVIILRTFSKIYALAGLRIGYGIASEEIIDYLDRVRHPFNVNSMAQKAALAALEDEEHLTNSCQLNNAGKEYLYQELEKLGLEYVPTETNFILFDVEQSAEDVFEQLLKQGIIVRNAGVFGYEEMIRVTIGTEEQNKKFIKALKNTLA